jgi:ubiquinone/menaquinone biosynthesis C-methylase UbiE
MSKNIDMETSDSFNDEYFKVYGNDKKRYHTYLDEYKDIKRLAPVGKVLDLGCGTGDFLSVFSDEYDKYGIDISDYAIKKSRERGIKVNDFDNAFEYPDEYFDIIILRGSLQLLPNPFQTLEICTKLLKPGGLLAFLSTPNSNSPYYRKFKTLPAICSPNTKKFLIPSDVMMKDILAHYGFSVTEVKFPYLDGHYSNFLKDHFFYLLGFLGIRKNFAFWRSMMNIYARK